MSSFLPASSSASPTSETPRSRDAWIQRIKTAQQSKMTPEVFQRLAENAERQKRAQSSIRACQRLEKVNHITSCSTAYALRSAETVRNEDYSSSPSYEVVEQQQRMRSAQIQEFAKSKGMIGRAKKTSSPSFSSPFSAPSAPSSVPPQAIQEEEEEAEREEEELERGLDEMEANLLVQASSEGLVLSPQIIPTSYASTSSSSVLLPPSVSITEVVTTGLESLRREPDNDPERAVKFAIFETVQETVSTVRGTVMEFWSESEDQFEGASRAGALQEIRNIDGRDNMAILDHSRNWFVYDMCIQANKNSDSISRLLTSLRIRLELLANELGDCPCCLETMEKGNVHTLACAHRMCNPCWEQWLELKGPTGAFCVLCKHENFVQEIFSQASP